MAYTKNVIEILNNYQNTNAEIKSNIGRILMNETINRIKTSEELYVNKYGNNNNKELNIIDRIEVNTLYCDINNPTPALKLYLSSNFYIKYLLDTYYDKFPDWYHLDKAHSWLLIHPLSQNAIKQKSNILKNGGYKKIKVERSLKFVPFVGKQDE